MQKYIRLKTGDGHTIYGVLDSSSKKSNTLAVFVHGLTGHPNEHTFYNAARMFPKKGVDVFRFALYDGAKGGRNLTDCTITTHAEDLNKVLAHFRKKYKTMAVIGHSLGSPTILKSGAADADVVVLWDPSYLEDFKVEKVLLRGKEMYIEEWGVTFLLNPALCKEWLTFDGKNELPLIAQLGKPLKIIAAGKGVLKEGSKRYAEAAQKPKDLTIIKNATHTFDEEGVEDELLKETLAWIKKHAK